MRRAPYLPIDASVFRFPGSRSRLADGFTLIELLVVVVIVAVLSLALTLSIAGNAERELTRESDRFGSLVAQACDEAELTGREIGIVVGSGGYSFRLLAGDRWQTMDNRSEWRPRRWVEGIGVDLSREGRRVDLEDASDAAPQLVCFSSGELTPFVLTLVLGDAPHYRVRGREDGKLDTERVLEAR